MRHVNNLNLCSPLAHVRQGEINTAYKFYHIVLSRITEAPFNQCVTGSTPNNSHVLYMSAEASISKIPCIVYWLVYW